MASPGIMPFESNEGQGAERVKVSCCGRRDPTAGMGLHAPKPVVDLLLDLILSVPVPRLDLALELLAISVNQSDVIIGKLAPLFLDLACHLLPIALDAVPVHDRALSSYGSLCWERRLPTRGSAFSANS